MPNCQLYFLNFVCFVSYSLKIPYNQYKIRKNSSSFVDHVDYCSKICLKGETTRFFVCLELRKTALSLQIRAKCLTIPERKQKVTQSLRNGFLINIHVKIITGLTVQLTNLLKRVKRAHQ